MLVRTLRDGGFRRSWMVLGECCISVLILFLSALTRFFLSFLGSTLFWLSWFTNGRCHHILVPFDTCRTYYDGTKMISRLGNPFAPPEWFLESKCSIHLLPRYQNVERSEIALLSSSELELPKGVTLDGELFAGRGEFQSTVSIVRTANSPHWKNHYVPGEYTTLNRFQKFFLILRTLVHLTPHFFPHTLFSTLTF